MSTFDTDNTLLREMLGKGGLNVVFTTAAQTGKDWYCIQFSCLISVWSYYYTNII